MVAVVDSAIVVLECAVDVVNPVILLLGDDDHHHISGDVIVAEYFEVQLDLLFFGDNKIVLRIFLGVEVNLVKCLDVAKIGKWGEHNQGN